MLEAVDRSESVVESARSWRHRCIWGVDSAVLDGMDSGAFEVLGQAEWSLWPYNQLLLSGSFVIIPTSRICEDAREDSSEVAQPGVKSWTINLVAHPSEGDMKG